MMYKTNSLIIYETVENLNYMESIISGFNTNVSTLNIKDYTQNIINDFDFVFIVNLQNEIDNKYLINNLNQYENKIYWIGDKIESLINFNSSYKIEYVERINNIHKIIYNNKSILLDKYDFFNVINILDNNSVKTIATMKNGYDEYPHIIKSKNLYYMSGFDVKEEDIFKNVLTSFYEVEYKYTEKQVPKIQVEEETKLEKNLETINDIIINFVFIVLIIFTIIFVVFRFLNKRKFRR